MEYKDAIYWLNNLIGKHGDEYDVALEMAINSLKQLNAPLNDKRQSSPQIATDYEINGAPYIIDKREAIAALQKCRKHCIDPFDSYHIDIQDAENELMKLPSVQQNAPIKPKSGHWIKDNTDDCPPVFKMFRICSECGCVRTEETKYCPNCGVYMEVDKNGTNR